MVVLVLEVEGLVGPQSGGKRAVGFELSDGMEVPEELSAFKFARSQKLAGTTLGSYFVIQGDYPV